jgi:hypothetical protein
MLTHIMPAGRRVLVRTAATLGTGVLASLAALSLGLGPVSGAGASVAHPAVPAAVHQHSYSFSLVPASPAVAACDPTLGGRVTITPNRQNDVMVVKIHGGFPNRRLDLFIVQKPTKPFGLAWYQTDVPIGANGSGTGIVQGVFSKATFSVSLGGTQTFAPTHLSHIGLWWNGPGAPFRHGCEPGATKPILTVFNRQQRAGIQALNSSNFPDNAGPLTHVSG